MNRPGEAQASHLASTSGPMLLLLLYVKKLSELSAQMSAKDPKDSFFRQLTFNGENPNPTFQPNPFKPDMGVDGRKITTYYRFAVKKEAHAKAAVQTACSNIASQVVASTVGDNQKLQMGGVFQGGFKVVGNEAFLAARNIRLIINTARSIESFFPKFQHMVDAAQRNGAVFIELNWLDDYQQRLSKADLRTAVREIHKARLLGNRVLIHCAQGLSRSGAVSVAYVATILEEIQAGYEITELPVSRVDAALMVVKAGRIQAQPNNSFMEQLRQHERSGLFASLRVELRAIEEGQLDVDVKKRSGLSCAQEQEAAATID